MKYLLNKQSLKLTEVPKNCSKDLLDLLKLDHYIFDTYNEALNRQNYLDTTIKFN